MRQPIAWSPSQPYISNAELTRFLRHCRCATFDEMQRRAAGNAAWFTGHVLDFLGIQWATPHRNVLNLDRGIAWPRWCEGGALNINTCLWNDCTAMVYEHESGETREWSYAYLARETAHWAAHFRSLGLRERDIGIFLPMAPATVAELLAVNALGAYLGEDPGDLIALENPPAFESISCRRT